MLHILTAAALSAATAQTPSSDWVILSTVKAGQLAEMCRNDVSALYLDPCNAFITGAVDGLQYARETCIKETSGLSYVATGIVRKYLSENPQEWGKPAILVIRQALREKFPCR